MDSDTTWFRVDLPDVPLYLEPLYHLVSFIAYALIITTLSLIVIHSGLYIVLNVPMRWEFFFFGFTLADVALIVLNSALIYSLTMSLSRGLMSTWLFIFSTAVYSAALKWMVGSLFIGFDTMNYWFVPMVAVYVSAIAELASLFRGTLSTALTYRT